MKNHSNVYSLTQAEAIQLKKGDRVVCVVSKESTFSEDRVEKGQVYEIYETYRNNLDDDDIYLRVYLSTRNSSIMQISMGFYAWRFALYKDLDSWFYEIWGSE